MYFSFTTKGSFKHLESFLLSMSKGGLYAKLDSLAQEGVSALESATPKDSGLAASSWYYTIDIAGSRSSITWENSDVENGYPVAIMIQYGHGTGTGGYVQGQDYINPAMQPIFDRIANQVWEAVTSA